LPNHLTSSNDPRVIGDVPEWLWSGLQNRVPRFNSGRRLHCGVAFSDQHGVALTSRRPLKSIFRLNRGSNICCFPLIVSYLQQ
jgi:hypothetical protein